MTPTGISMTILSTLRLTGAACALAAIAASSSVASAIPAQYSQPDGAQQPWSLSAPTSSGLTTTASPNGDLQVGFSGALVSASSYSYTNSTTPGQAGYASYDDPGKTKLTDGNLGSTEPTDGTWVGWQGTSEQITFNFASSMTIKEVSVDFLRDDNANTQVAGTVQIGSTVFNPADFTTDMTKGLVNFSGSWTGSQLVMTLDNRNGAQTWDFVNEVEFSSASSAAPEPGTIGLALGGLIGAFVWFRRRNNFAR